LRGVTSRPQVVSANTHRKQLTSLWLSNEIFDIKTTNRSQYVTSPLLDTAQAIKRKPLAAIEAAGNTAQATTGRINRFVDDLDILCPVSLHQKLAFDRYDTECKCKKFAVPLINDVEYDYLIRLLPAEQLSVVVAIDS
jgi:hypothetical protein